MIDKAVDSPEYYLAKFPDIYRHFLVATRIPEYSYNTEKSYLGWVNRFLRFHHGCPPCQLSESSVAAFLGY